MVRLTEDSVSAGALIGSLLGQDSLTYMWPHHLLYLPGGLAPKRVEELHDLAKKLACIGGQMTLE